LMLEDRFAAHARQCLTKLRRRRLSGPEFISVFGAKRMIYTSGARPPLHSQSSVLCLRILNPGQLVIKQPAHRWLWQVCQCGPFSKGEQVKDRGRVGARACRIATRLCSLRWRSVHRAPADLGRFGERAGAARGINAGPHRGTAGTLLVVPAASEAWRVSIVPPDLLFSRAAFRPNSANLIKKGPRPETEK